MGENRPRIAVTLDADDGLAAGIRIAALLPAPWSWTLRALLGAAAEAAQALPPGAHWIAQLGPLRIRFLAPDGQQGGSGVEL